MQQSNADETIKFYRETWESERLSLAGRVHAIRTVAAIDVQTNRRCKVGWGWRLKQQKVALSLRIQLQLYPL